MTTATRFSASCWHKDKQLTFDDPDAFTEHMKAQHDKPWYVREREKAKAALRLPRKLSTRQRDYQPKRLDPGQPITFWQEAEPEPYRRTGVIWSQGDRPRSLWVIPDDKPTTAVLVIDRARRDREPDWHCSDLEDGEHWKRTVRRIENVRRRGVYAVVDRIERRYAGHGRWETSPGVKYHADPDCPDAFGSDDIVKPPADFQPTVWSVVGELLRLHELPAVPRHWCERCIWLRENEEAAA